MRAGLLGVSLSSCDFNRSCHRVMAGLAGRDPGFGHGSLFQMAVDGAVAGGEVFGDPLDALPVFGVAPHDLGVDLRSPEQAKVTAAGLLGEDDAKSGIGCFDSGPAFHSRVAAWTTAIRDAPSVAPVIGWVNMNASAYGVSGLRWRRRQDWLAWLTLNCRSRWNTCHCRL